MSYLYILDTNPLLDIITASLSIHLLVDPRCFHILVIVGNAAAGIGMHMSFQVSVLFSDKYPEVELLDRMLFLFLIF